MHLHNHNFKHSTYLHKGISEIIEVIYEITKVMSEIIEVISKIIKVTGCLNNIWKKQPSRHSFMLLYESTDRDPLQCLFITYKW